MNISTTIKRQYFDEILLGDKVLEFRSDTAYWRKRLEGKNIDKITLLCGRESLTCRVHSVAKVRRPAGLELVISTPECWAFELDMNTIVATVRNPQ